MTQLWALDSFKDVNEYIDELDCDERWDALSLVWLASMIMLETEGGLASYKKEADNLITRSMLM